MVLDGAVDPLADPPHRSRSTRPPASRPRSTPTCRTASTRATVRWATRWPKESSSFIDFFKSARPEPAADLERARPHRGAGLPRRHRHAVQQGELALPDAGDAAGAGGSRRHAAGAGRLLQPTARQTAPTRGTRPRSNPAVNCLDHPQDVLGAADRGQRAGVPEGVERLRTGSACGSTTAARTGPSSPPRSSPTSPRRARRRSSSWARPATRRRRTQQAVKLADELDSGVLLSRDGDGHTAYSSGNSCIDDAINGFFLTGTPPADGKQC